MIPYAVFLDIDGTVMHHNQVTDRDKEAIFKARSAGHFVFINTGRAYSYVPDIIRHDLKVNGVIAGLGADIRIGGRQIYSKTLPFSLLDRAAELLEDVCFLFEGEDAMYQQGTLFQSEHKVIQKGIPFSVQYPQARISKLSLFGTPRKEALEELTKDLMYFRFPHYSEMGRIGQTKATGMERVLQLLNIPRERSIAIGDSENDSHMLQAAGISVAMGNAPESLQQRCDYVTETVDQSGVACAIERLLFSGDVAKNCVGEAG